MHIFIWKCLEEKMGRKDSKVIINILKFYNVPGIDESDMYIISQNLLNLYKDMNWFNDINNHYVSKVEKYTPEDIIEDLKNLMNYSGDEDVESIKALYESGRLFKLIRCTVAMTQSYPRKGTEYFNCLLNTFLDPENECVECILDKLNVSRGTYYEMRHEAIVLFGAIFWGSVIPFCINTAENAFTEMDSYLDTIYQKYLTDIEDTDLNELDDKS